MFCAAIVAPGQACTPAVSITQQVDQCGYMGYCINATCTIPYSLPSGVTGIPSAIPQQFASRFCKTGYASSTGSTNGNYSCVVAPTTDSTQLNGVTVGTACKLTVTNADGTTDTTQTNTALCGYNQDNKYYCPWALGDAPAQAVLTALTGSNLF